MGTLVGFVFGYVVGAKAGPELLSGVLEQGKAVLRETPPAGRASHA
jgi:hypothetical protein